MSTNQQCLTSDPEIMSGAVVFAGTRLPFAFLMEYLESGSTVEEFVDHYPPVTAAQAVLALKEAAAIVDEAVHARAEILPPLVKLKGGYMPTSEEIDAAIEEGRDRWESFGLPANFGDVEMASNDRVA